MSLSRVRVLLPAALVAWHFNNVALYQQNVVQNATLVTAKRFNSSDSEESRHQSANLHYPSDNSDHQPGNSDHQSEESDHSEDSHHSEDSDHRDVSVVEDSPPDSVGSQDCRSSPADEANSEDANSAKHSIAEGSKKLEANSVAADSEADGASSDSEAAEFGAVEAFEVHGRSGLLEARFHFCRSAQISKPIKVVDFFKE
jgi:hypothetical protein